MANNYSKQSNISDFLNREYQRQRNVSVTHKSVIPTCKTRLLSEDVEQREFRSDFRSIIIEGDLPVIFSKVSIYLALLFKIIRQLTRPARGISIPLADIIYLSIYLVSHSW